MNNVSTPLNPHHTGVSESLIRRGGANMPHKGNKNVAKSNFETYKSYDHMPKIIPISQKFNEILRFVNFETTRF